MSSRKKLPIVALIYDFDGTLAAGNMQEYSFIQSVGEKKENFWGETAIMAEEQDSDNVLVYMLLMLKKAREQGISIRRESFQKFGESVKLFEGVKEWFRRISDFGMDHGVIVEHYINSSGMKEMIEGTPIASEFKTIFASSFYYDKNGDAQWPAAAVNYTNKTQFLYKINKGIFTIRDSVKINESMPDSKKRVPFTNMLYFGDGETDVPCMKLIKQMGGNAITVYEPNNEKKRDIAKKILNQERCDYVCPADYSPGKSLDILVKSIICKIKADDNLIKLKQEFKRKGYK